MNTKTYWLENLKPGDTVIKVHIGSKQSKAAATVLRVTKTMVVLCGGERYSRTTAARIGESQGRIDPTDKAGAAIAKAMEG